jgi:predicted Zn-dependent peptidase
MPIKKTELPNGLRLLTERITSVRSIAIGVWVDVGSRNETREEGGVSHLIEHMHFKGTRSRSALKLANEIEQLGGALNAFTTREQTCYYARILDENLPQTIDVLSDMLMNSTFTPGNLKKEKQVVLEEIKETEDTPSEVVHDLFAETFWGDHPLGRPILGASDAISTMPRKTVMNYINRHYTAPKIVIAAAGNFRHDDLLKLVKKHFKFPAQDAPPAEKAHGPETSRIKFVERDIAQNHFVMGYPSMEFSHKTRFAALGLNFFLGGGMSSALFQDIREKRGLAYSVYSLQDFYRDAGSFGIYLSTDGRSLPLALNLLQKHVRKLKRKAI